ncbi:MAG: YesL family protein [Clostridia bacterium]|nr:YesL family protein [Clostridia bacterium]
MSGFFGLFNYEKEGPGVEKDAPQKKGFFLFFDLYFKNFWKLVVSSIWFILLSIPVVTSGLAFAGFTNVARNLAIDSHSFGTSDFFETIKKNWKQALPAGIINLLIFALLIWDLYFFYTVTTGIFSLVALAMVLTLLFIFITMNFYLWTIMVTFKLKLKQIYVNSFKFAILCLKRNILIVVSLLAIYAATISLLFLNVNIITMLYTAIVLFVLPGFTFLLIEFNVFPKIKKHMIIPYYKDHPNEDLELRHRMGIE